MAHVLVAYATTVGHARKVADHAVERLKAAGQAASLVDARTANRSELGWFDAAMLTGALDSGQSRATLAEFVRNHRSQLNRVPTAFVSVTPLTAAGVGWRNAGVHSALRQFFAELDWSATCVHVTSGVARETLAEWFERLIGQSVFWARPNAMTGETVHPVDWDALDTFTDRFLVEEVEPAVRQTM